MRAGEFVRGKPSPHCVRRRRGLALAAALGAARTAVAVRVRRRVRGLGHVFWRRRAPSAAHWVAAPTGWDDGDRVLAQAIWCLIHALRPHRWWRRASPTDSRPGSFWRRSNASAPVTSRASTCPPWTPACRFDHPRGSRLAAGAIDVHLRHSRRRLPADPGDRKQRVEVFQPHRTAPLAHLGIPTPGTCERSCKLVDRMVVDTGLARIAELVANMYRYDCARRPDAAKPDASVSSSGDDPNSRHRVWHELLATRSASRLDLVRTR